MNFQEKYKIIRKIGIGATASVFVVEDRRRHEQRAVKIIVLSAFQTEQMILIRNEIHIMQQLSIPQAPELIEVMEESDRVYIVMSYIQGMNLRQYIESCGGLFVKQSTGSVSVGKVTDLISVEKAVGWILELCRILEQLHSMKPAIIFCDLKPENIIVREDGTLALVDFGSACQCMDGVTVSDTPFRTGSEGYAAPELYKEDSKPDIRADIYSLGAVGKFMLYPFGNIKSVRNSCRRMESVPDLYKKMRLCRKANQLVDQRKLWRLLERCMEPDKEKRYSTCAEIINKLMKNQ